MAASRPSIYIGCSLTQAPEAFKTAVDELKVSLRADYEVFEFLGLVKGTAADVYDWDINHCLKNCDLFVAICDYPAIGLGYELGTAIEAYAKPVLAVAHCDANISRLLEGISASRYDLKRYQELSEVPNFIRAAFASITK